MRIRLGAVALAAVLVIVGALGAAEARRSQAPVAGAGSRGVIVLPGAKLAGLARLRAGDTPSLAGTRVRVEQADPEAGLLVSSAALGDAALAQALVAAGVDAEVNHPRHILPITPTAELFSTPQATRPEDLPNKPDLWHVEQVGADIVHHSGITGTASLIVGVIDTGVDTSHPLLAGVTLPGFDFVQGDTEPDDIVGHGTHVAGIVHSICPRCSILPVKVLDEQGGDDYTIARGIRYARQRGARIIQISLGGPAPSVTMCQAVRDVETQGAQVVVAAGNNAGSDDYSIGYPALCSPDTLLVSATDRYDLPAWFSNYGPAIDLAAPGYNVWSTIPPFYDNDDDGLVPASGTSMAAPQVSGAAALLWSANPAWTAAQIRARLIATARPIGVMPGVDEYGPRLDVAQAFGLRSRPIVVGLTVDKPWTPSQGSDQDRTVVVRAHVRGDAITSVQLAVTLNGATQQVAMALQGGEIYAASYVVPKNTSYRREHMLQVVATNSAGKDYSAQEVVEQDGSPIPPPRIRMAGTGVRQNTEIQFTVEWDGNWNNFDFDCDGSGLSPIFYIPKGQPVTCFYPDTGEFVAYAKLYYQNSYKIAADMPIVVLAPPPVYLPIVRR